MRYVSTGLLLIGLMLGLWGPALSAQVKYEKEERIPEAEVPASALDFVDEIGPTRKVDWYREENLDGEAIEVKLKRKGVRYSIKFDSEGELIDVEKQIQWRNIPEEVREDIEEEWEEIFERQRIEKIQIQFPGERLEGIQWIRGADDALPPSPLYYEIVVKGRKDDYYELYEFLFDAEGDMEAMNRIVTRRTDNMEF
jgi:hypothetical protein